MRPRGYSALRGWGRPMAAFAYDFGSEDLPDDDEKCLHSVASQRKRAEEDVKLLANRIKHLKAEEERARQKAQEVREKTQALYSVRERRTADQMRREAIQEAAQKADKERRHALRRQQLGRECNVRRRQEEKGEHLVAAARADRNARAEELLRKAEAEDREQRVLRDRANNVRRSEYAAAHARAGVAVANQIKARVKQDNRRVEETRQIRDATARLEEMGREELKVLSRLQHSQLLYESACAEYQAVRAPREAALPPKAATPRGMTKALPPPGPLRLTPRARPSSLPPRRDELPALTEKAAARPASSTSTAPSERADAGKENPAPVNAVPAPTKTITYTTMDGTTVTIPVVE